MGSDPAAAPAFVGRGDDPVGNPHRAQICQCELFELFLLLTLDKHFPVERFEVTVSQSAVPSPPLILVFRQVFVFLDPKHDVDLRDDKPDAMYLRSSPKVPDDLYSKCMKFQHGNWARLTCLGAFKGHFEVESGHDSGIRAPRPETLEADFARGLLRRGAARMAEFLHVLGYQSSFDMEFQQGLLRGTTTFSHR